MPNYKLHEEVQDELQKRDTEKVDALTEALVKLPPAALARLLERANVATAAPSTIGMTPEQFQTIVATVGTVNVKAMQQALRTENPHYPERSVFNPVGLFDDAGTQMPPKVVLKRDTYFVGVLVGKAGATSEIYTPDELELFNRFTGDKETRNGTWTATLLKRDNREILAVVVPHRTNDERMGLTLLTHILLELLEGEDAVAPNKLLDQVTALRARVAALEAGPPAETAAARG